MLRSLTHSKCTTINLSMSPDNYTVIGLGLCSMGAELLQRREHLLSPPTLLRTSIAISQSLRVRSVFVFPPLFGASVDNPKATHAFEGSSLLTALSLRPKRSNRSFSAHYAGYQSTRLSVPYEILTSMSLGNAARKMTPFLLSLEKRNTHKE